MRVLLSIKPEFAWRIFSGSKRFEFRRVRFRRPIRSVVVYASAPVSKVIGEFEVEELLHEDLASLWEKTGQWAGISEECFYAYFSDRERGYAIKVKTATRYEEALPLQQHFGLKPPQSFIYLSSARQKRTDPSPPVEPIAPQSVATI